MSRGDSGYAMLAAIAGIAVFAVVGFDLVAANRGAIATVQAEVEHARLVAAADAGLMSAIHGLGMENIEARWPIDGRPQTMRFGDVVLTITVEDERGKIALNTVSEDTIKWLLSAAGVSGSRLDTLSDSIGDWLDEDDAPRANGGEGDAYASLGIEPRDGGFRTVEELRLVKGMDAELYRKIAPAVTVFFELNGPFEPDTASPLALAAMSFGGASSVESLERERELAGQRTTLEFGTSKPVIGRPFTVRVVARSASGAFQRTAIVELTGDDANPYWIRYAD